MTEENEIPKAFNSSLPFIGPIVNSQKIKSNFPKVIHKKNNPLPIRPDTDPKLFWRQTLRNISLYIVENNECFIACDRALQKYYVYFCFLQQRSRMNMRSIKVFSVLSHPNDIAIYVSNCFQMLYKVHIRYGGVMCRVIWILFISSSYDMNMFIFNDCMPSGIFPVSQIKYPFLKLTKNLPAVYKLWHDLHKRYI